jgi:hypothetical protein
MIRFTNVPDSKVVEWMAESDIDTKHERANHIVRSCERLIEEIQSQLDEAQRDLRIAQALKQMTHVFPTWRCTLGNLRITSHEGQQKACAELGYDYYVFNEQVFAKSGVPCGMSVQDLK